VFHVAGFAAQSSGGSTAAVRHAFDASGRLVPTADTCGRSASRPRLAPVGARPPGSGHAGGGRPAVGAPPVWVGVTVVDSVGEARAMLTADGSDGSHVFVAMRKALTRDLRNSEFKANELVQRTRRCWRGAANMFVEGQFIVVGQTTIGAIGVSGAGAHHQPGRGVRQRDHRSKIN
jgi:hypothetical protein